MPILRHRNADAVPVSHNKPSSSRSRFHGRSTGSSKRLLWIVGCFLWFIVLVYTVVLSKIVNTAKRGGPGPGGGGAAAATGKLPNNAKRGNPGSRGAVGKYPNKDGAKKQPKRPLEELSGQELLSAQQEHVSKPLKELIPKLKSLKEKYPPVDRTKRTKYNIFKEFNQKNQVQLDKKFDKKGNLVYNPITSVKKEDLESMGFPQKKIDAVRNITHDEAIKGRERLVEILNEAGILDIDPEAIAMLPKWSAIEKLYGKKPVVLGLERCEEFRTLLDPADASIGPAGMFNTGTNPLAMYLSENCRLPKNKKDKAGGTRWVSS